MTRPRSQFRRPDLMYRAMLRDEQDAPNDALFDLLTRKVVEHLHKTDISDWDNNLWGTYKEMLKQHTKAPILHGKSDEDQIEEMSVEQLRAMMNSDEA